MSSMRKMRFEEIRPICCGKNGEIANNGDVV